MESVWTQFSAAAESEPDGKAVRQAFDRIVRRTVTALMRGTRRELQALARRADRFVRSFEKPDAGAELLRERLVGRMEMLAAVCRLALANEVSNDVMRVIRGRLHAQRVLTALRHREIGVSALAAELDIDISQLSKLLDKLAEHELIETQKDDRTRWVRLTALGERAAVIDLEAREVPEVDDSEPLVAAAAATPADVAALMIRIEDMVIRVAERAKDLEDAARKLGSAAEQASANIPIDVRPATTRPEI